MHKFLIVSSCTKSKRGYPCEAKELYLGKGHEYVRDAIEIFNSKGIDVGWKILSAGLGLIDPVGKKFAPYDITFQGKNLKQINEMSSRLSISKSFDDALQKYNTIILLLSTSYLQAIQFDKLKNLSNKTIIIANSTNSKVLNNKIFKNIKNVNLINWYVPNYSKFDGKIPFRGSIIKLVAETVNSKEDFVNKYCKNLIFIDKSTIK